MKYLTISLAFLSLTSCAVAQKKGIKFEEGLSWTQIRNKAKLENKFILMDAYATWCGPCKLMDDEVFTIEGVGDEINPQFVSVKVQMDRTPQDSEFIRSTYEDVKMIGEAYKITGYPTILFFSPDGKLVSRFSGTRDGVGLIKEAKKALDPSTQYYSLLESYRTGALDTASLRKLVFAADAAGDNAISNEVAEKYIMQFSIADLYKKETLMFIGRFLNGSKDRNFNIFLKQAKKVNGIVGIKYYAEAIVMAIISKELIDPHSNDSKIDWFATEKNAKSKFGALGEEVVWGYRMMDANRKKDWINFGRYYKLYYDRAIPLGRSLFHINNMSWEVVEHVDDLNVIKTAILAAKYSVDNFGENDPGDIDTYANLLYKGGIKSEAIQWEEKALKLSVGDERLKTTLSDTLKKMKAGVKIW